VTGPPGALSAHGKKRLSEGGGLQKELREGVCPCRHDVKKSIPVGDGEFEARIERVAVEAVQEVIPAAAFQQFVTRDNLLPATLMVFMGRYNEGVDLSGDRVGDKGEVGLMKSTIGKAENDFVVQANCPDEAIRAGRGCVQSVRRVNDEISLGLYIIEQTAKRRNHLPILDSGSSRSRNRYRELRPDRPAVESADTG
jgi:hypothetical protein